MGAQGRAYTRVDAPLERARGAFSTEIAGDGQARVRVHPDRAIPAGPPRGALRIPATWRASGRSGHAVLTVTPFWTWGFELEVAVAAPRSLGGRLLWPRRRLERLATGLARSLGRAAERPAREGTVQLPGMGRRVPSAGAATSRWSFVTATGGRPSQ